MPTARRLLLLLALGALAAPAMLVGPSPRAAAAEILKGLPRRFAIRIEPLDSDGRAAGLAEASLVKVIQSRLQKQSIPTGGNGDPELYARIVVLTSRDVKNVVLGYGAHVEVSLREKALLARDKRTEFMAPIWFKGNVTVANPKQFIPQVVAALADLTDQFLAEYQSENFK